MNLHVHTLVQGEGFVERQGQGSVNSHWEAQSPFTSSAWFLCGFLSVSVLQFCRLPHLNYTAFF